MATLSPTGKIIRAKRRSRGISTITRQVANGEPHSERGYILLGHTNTALLSGKKGVADWSDEELARGKRRDRNGGWIGQAPKVVPKVVHDELVKRTLATANRMLMENTEAAVEALIEIVKGADTEDRDRLKAISMVMDRVMGKTPEKIDMKTDTPPWVMAIQGSIVSIKSGEIYGMEEEELEADYEYEEEEDDE